MKSLKLIITSLCSLLLVVNSKAQTTTFNYTGSMQTFIVPSGVDQLSIDMYGAKGGNGGLGSKIGGAGGRLQTTLSVVPGQTLYIYVGGAGVEGDCSSNGPFSGGFNGGGDAYYCGGSGGGASDIRINGTSFNDRVIVVGGGAGAGDDYPSGDKGGDGGDLIGQNGEYGTDPLHSATGKGGSQSSGGAGGINPSPSIDDALEGGFGFGGRGSTTYAGGGGGGGYFGGGGGAGAGGGGGSSYADPALTSGTSHIQGDNFANGLIVITEICNNEPIPNDVNLADVEASCEVTSLTAPTASSCLGTFNGTSDVTFPITTQGTTTVTWTYDDGNGHTSIQTQDVIINDVTAPVADIATLSNVTSECSVTSLTIPTATDNCVGSVIGTHNATLPITVQGITTVTWTYDDGNGNTSTQTQDVVITPIDNGITQVDAITLSADASGYTYQWIDCDNGNQAINGAINQAYTATVAGNYAVEISNGTCTVTSNCLGASVGLEEHSISAVSVYPNPTSGFITLSSTEKIEEIFITNTFGQIIFAERMILSDLCTIDLTFVPSGVYNIIIKYGDVQLIKRFIKK